MTAAVILTEMDCSDLRVAASILSSVGGPTGTQLAANLQRIAAAGFRFAKTYCSSCGGEFGPGNEGFAHCEDHGTPLDSIGPGAAYV